MNWLERYVEAVKRYLPADQRQDVGEELYSLLQEKLDDTIPAGLRAPTEETTLAVLREFGHPLQVASRYRSTRPLVSETLMPMYKQLLKFLVLGWFTAYIAATLISVSDLFAWWPRDVDEFIEAFALWSIVLVTLGFHFSDALVERFDFLNRWNPRRLPPVGPPMPLFDHVSGLIFGLIGFAILTAIDNQVSLEIFLARTYEPWATVILWARCWLLLGMAFDAVALFRPYWTAVKRLYGVGHDVLLTAMAAWAFTHTHSLFVINLVLMTVMVAGVVGAGSQIYKLMGTRGSMAPDTWIDKRLRQDINKATPEDLAKDIQDRVQRP